MNEEDCIDYEFGINVMAEEMCREIDKEIIKELHMHFKKEKEELYDDAMEILNDIKK